jgi:methane monooxygenase PmoA-like
MKRQLIMASLLLATAYAGLVLAQGQVRITPDPAKKQFAVAIAGKPFTTYCYGPEFADKPVFYPVLSPNGARINREFPMVKDVPGETNDHPHHQSAWFTYDEVNGIHFWNPDTSGRHIEHRDARLGLDGNTLTALLAWKDKDGNVVLDETKRVTFGGDATAFWMDHDITLKATIPVVFGDTKEGAFGIRLNDTLKETGGTGRFINAEGLETEAKVWGKTSAWVALRGTVKDNAGDKDVTVAIFPHPTSFNSPPYWHARGYGLFAANPFGAHAYDPKVPERATKLASGDSVHLRYRMVVYSGKVEKTRLDQDFAGFAR